MGLSKAKNLFDQTDTADLDGYDNLGAFLRGESGNVITDRDISGQRHLDVFSALADGAGTALTSTLVGSDQALDVNMVNEISVDVQGDYDVSTNATPDSVGMIAHDRGATQDETSQNIRPTGGAPSADNLDPTDIQALDMNSYLMGWDGSAWDRLTTDANGLQVSVQNDVNVTDSASAIENTNVSVAATATQLVSSALSGRREITIQNDGNKDIFIGKDNTVTTANGIRVARGGSATYKWNDSVDPYAISESGTVDVRVLEAA